jgi:pheromone shutdown protein TraB
MKNAPPDKKGGIVKTYRWNETDYQYLENLNRTVSAEVGEKLGHTDILRGALKVAAQTEPRVLYKASLDMQVEEAQARANAKLNRLENIKAGGAMEVRVEASDYFGFISDEVRITLDDEKLLFFDSAKGEIVHGKGDHCLVYSPK